MEYLLFIAAVILIARITYHFIKPKEYEKSTLPEAFGAETENEFYISNDNCFTTWREKICLN